MAPTMSFASTSNGRAPSQYPSHPMSPPVPQPPRSRNHQDILRPNFGDTRSDDPRRSVTQPNPDSLLVSRSRVPRDPDQNLDPSSSHLFFTPTGSSQPLDLRLGDGLGATLYPTEGPHLHASSSTDVRQHAYYAPPRTRTAHPTTMPYTGPSRLGGEQPALLSRYDSTAPPGLPFTMMAAPAPAAAPPPSTPLPLLPFNIGPGLPHFSPAALVAAPAQALGISNVDVIAEESSASRRVPPARHRHRQNRRHRPVPLVRVKDEVEWTRPDVLKVTLWLNWSPNADAEAHLPWES